MGQTGIGITSFVRRKLYIWLRVHTTVTRTTFEFDACFHFWPYAGKRGCLATATSWRGRTFALSCETVTKRWRCTGASAVSGNERKKEGRNEGKRARQALKLSRAKKVVLMSERRVTSVIRQRSLASPLALPCFRVTRHSIRGHGRSSGVHGTRPAGLHVRGWRTPTALLWRTACVTEAPACRVTLRY